MVQTDVLLLFFCFILDAQLGLWAACWGQRGPPNSKRLNRACATREGVVSPLEKEWVGVGKEPGSMPQPPHTHQQA